MKTWDLMHLERNMPDDWIVVIGKDAAIAMHIPSQQMQVLPGFADLQEMVSWLREVADAMESETASAVLRAVQPRQERRDVQTLS